MFRSILTFPNWPDIKKSLSEIADQHLTAEAIVDKIVLFKNFSHMSRMKNQEGNISGKFPVLFLQYEKELPEIYAKVANFLLKRPAFQIPLFNTGDNKEHFYTKEQILYLFSTMLTCLVPSQEYDENIKLRDQFGMIMDFSIILQQEPYKTNTIMEYIKTELENEKAYDQKVMIRRNVEKRPLQQIIDENKGQKMETVEIKDDKTSIEEFNGCIKTDFANEYLGGGSLMGGCVQEEIMFANHPQLYTAQLLCGIMEPNEAIHLMGYKKYSKNTGYGWSTAYAGQEKMEYKYDNNNMAMEYITAIDAVCYASDDSEIQFSQEHLDREILKAYAGFNFPGVQSNTVVTGNWGCGAFRGDLRLKFLVQWLACSLAKKHMIYCPFGHNKTVNDQQMVDKMSKLTISDFYSTILQASEKAKQTEQKNIYEFL